MFKRSFHLLFVIMLLTLLSACQPVAPGLVAATPAADAEAQPQTLILAPTTSTTVMLALGDALAMAVLRERDLTKEEFARFHPGGELGRSLMRVREVMRMGDEMPLVPSGSSVAVAVDAMTSTPGRPGSVLIVRDDGTLSGMFTDGDLRRLLRELSADAVPGLLARSIDEVMTQGPITLHPDALVGEATHVLRERKIDQLAVVDADLRPVGLLDIQDLLEVRVL